VSRFGAADDFDAGSRRENARVRREGALETRTYVEDMIATPADSTPIVVPHGVSTPRNVATMSRDVPAPRDVSTVPRDVPAPRDVPTSRGGSFDGSAPARTGRTARYVLDHVTDDALHAGVKSLAGRYNGITADLLAHLAEVDARGNYRERACSSLYTYCVYELRFSEDEAQRRSRAARTARAFPVLFEMLAEGAIHLTGLLLLAPYLTAENHAELLARARFRTKREIEHLVAEVAPRPDVPARIEPLGPRPVAGRSTWQAYTASLRGPVRELEPGVGAGDAPRDVLGRSCDGADYRPVTDAHAPARIDEPDAQSGSAPARIDDVHAGSAPAPVSDVHGGSAPERVDAPSFGASKPLGAIRYRVEFTASERYVELVEEARNLLQHKVPDRDVARVHELAMAAFVEQLRKRRMAKGERPRRAAESDGPAPVRVDADDSEQSAPARVDANESAPARVPHSRDGSAPARVNAVESESDGAAPARAAGGADRHVRVAIRREVWRRDEGCCTFADASGRRCRERAGLEIHHEHAFALGGPTTLENLRLMCRAHNALFAERDFGRAHVDLMKSGRREAAGYCAATDLAPFNGW
jgi:hypothetical protein